VEWEFALAPVLAGNLQPITQAMIDRDENGRGGSL
jgi:hypothetical protein